MPIAERTAPHGPALPYGTDSFRAEGIVYRAVRQANELGGQVLALPVQRISLNNNFRALPFACRLSVPTFMAMLEELIDFLAADGIARVVIVNAHGGNPETIQATLRHLARRDGPFVCLLSASQCCSAEARAAIVHPSDHAGEGESSEVLYLRPELVRTERLGNSPMVAPAFTPLREVNAWFVRPWHRYMPDSCGGEARQASAAKGEAVVESSAAGLARFLHALSVAPDSEGFPY
ncbi:MAG: creatininase family protein [Armatimonadetes bacterium]|nr:creatininase family protein [Armatimonadota bacterium]